MALPGLSTSLNKIKSSFTKILLPLAGIGLLFSSPLAYATPDFSGSWIGTLSGTEVGDPICAGPFTEDVLVTINQLNGGNFSGSGTESGVGHDTETFDVINGFVDSSGNVSGNLDSHDGEWTGSFTGTLSGNTVNVTVMAQDDGFPGTGLCQWTSSGTLTRSSSDVIVTPAVTPSSTVTSVINFTSQIQAVTSDLGARIQNVMRGTGKGLHADAGGLKLEGMSGLNAGEGLITYGAWVSYSYSDFDNDLSSTAMDGNRHSVLGGFDFAPWESTVFGVAVGYEDSDTDTTFNLGNVETDGYTIAPYFGALLTDTWSVNFSFGYSNIDYDQFRTTGGTRITSSTDADRWFGMFNLNGVTYYDNWIIGGRVGTLWAKNEVDGFTESNGNPVGDVRSKLGTWSIGGDVAYSYGAFEPFVSATYEKDYSLTEIAVTTGPQPANDRDDVLFAAGVRYFGTNNGISGNLDWTRRLGREDFDEDMFSLSIRVDF